MLNNICIVEHTSFFSINALTLVTELLIYFFICSFEKYFIKIQSLFVPS